MTNAVFRGEIIILNVFIKREKQSNKIQDFRKLLNPKENRT